jgi:Tol biopolymer transport system component
VGRSKLWVVIATGLVAAAPPAPEEHGARPAAPFLFTPMDERGVAFSPDGNTAVYSLRIADYRQALIVVERKRGHWGTPEVAPFSGVDFDGTPSFSPDGRQLLFASDRDGKGDFDIWIVAHGGLGWGKPRRIGGAVNSPASETSPLLTRSGSLYFVSSRSGGGDIYVSDPAPDGFAEPRSVGPGVNSDYPEGGPAISADEKVMVFASAGRPDQPLAKGEPYTRSDLYISHRVGGRWSKARRLGPQVNSWAAETGPSFSGDGRWLYFNSEHGFATDQQVLLTPETLHRGWATARNGLGNVYMIAASRIERRK